MCRSALPSFGLLDVTVSRTDHHKGLVNFCCVSFTEINIQMNNTCRLKTYAEALQHTLPVNMEELVSTFFIIFKPRANRPPWSD